MAVDDSDSAEIDYFIRRLTARTPQKTVGTASAPSRLPTPAPPIGRPVVARHTAGHPVRRWMLVRQLMPSMPAPGPGRDFSLGSAISGLDLPDLSRVVRMPGPVAMVRMWVGLAVVHGASMGFWPYAKTYLWGLVFYLLSLGLVVVAGIWGARLSWDARLGAAHTVSLMTVLWAVVLAAAEIVPLL